LPRDAISVTRAPRFDERGRRYWLARRIEIEPRVDETRAIVARLVSTAIDREELDAVRGDPLRELVGGLG
jgi:hypothetical protein